MMTPRKVNGMTVLRCVNTKCGYEEGSVEQVSLKSTVKHAPREKTLVIEDDMDVKNLQKIKGIICPNCRNDEAYFWILQTRSADEPATRFYRCTKCNKVWREYE